MRPPGFEPGSLAWKASILPLYNERKPFDFYTTSAWVINCDLK